MCTVSFIPCPDTVFITSNRDEKHTRCRATPPAIYYYKNASLLFPKDKDSGGTWIAAKQNGDVAVLLNGAFQLHVAAKSYRKSRGLVLLDVLRNEDPSTFFSDYNCEGIEPFTLILYSNKKLNECRWNGAKKFLKPLPVQQSYIWSSATLYTTEATNKRKSWFDEWQMINWRPTQNDIIHFHRFTGDGNKSNDLFMNRDDETLTVSITSIAINDKKISMTYWDAMDNKEYRKDSALEQPPYNL